MKLSNNQQAFFALVRAGLWEQGVHLLPFGRIDYFEIFELAEEQSVMGLVAAGIEHVSDLRLPVESSLEFVGCALQLEQLNAAMNSFIETLIGKLYKTGINAVLVKGQGIAQCYERPQWRASGDVDLLLDEENYYRAKDYLMPIAQKVDDEDTTRMHLGMTMEGFIVELHGTLKGNCWKRLDSVLEKVQDDILGNKSVRSWRNGVTDIFLPSHDNDVIYVFSHILQHFFRGGIGLRQICDWCRLLWIFRESLDVCKLEQRLKEARAMTEWKAFSAFAVEYLGMPVEAMPLYSPSKEWSRKAKRMLSFILETGNFGHNRNVSYINEQPYLVRKIISLWRRTKDCFRYLFIFPVDSLKVWKSMIVMGIGDTLNGK